MLHPGNELLGATSFWVAKACVQLASTRGDATYWAAAVEHLQASLEQLEMAYPPESIARALQALVVWRVRQRGGADLCCAAAEVIHHHFGAQDIPPTL